MASAALDRLSALDQQAVDYPILDESAQLQVALMQVRYLNVDEGRVALLRRPMAGSWNEAIACAIRARLRLNADDYVRGTQICRQGVDLINAMAARGGSDGAYLRSYLQLLDGIAHIGGAAKFQKADFYSDAFDRLRLAWEAATEAHAFELVDLAVGWLCQLSKSTSLLVDKRWQVIHTGVMAFLLAQGVGAGQIAGRSVPPIPWFDEGRVFPT